MRIDESVKIETIQDHLIAKRSGVSLDVATVPGHPGEHRGFKAVLDACDVSRLILWREFGKCTANHDCTLRGLLPSAADLPRVRSFVDGDSSKGLGSLELISVPNMELVLVTKDAVDGWLYIIDGNNRAIAQSIQEKSFQELPVLVCEHPAMDRWVYIPPYYKKLWNMN